MHGLDICKARICRGNTHAHLHFFFFFFLRIKTQKGRAATQMDSSSASRKISPHRLPSKSKCPSIRKHSIVVIITVNSISFYETAISREIFSKTAHLHKNSPVAKSYVSKAAGFYRSNHRKRSVKKVFVKFKALCQRLF